MDTFWDWFWVAESSPFVAAIPAVILALYFHFSRRADRRREERKDVDRNWSPIKPPSPPKERLIRPFRVPILACIAGILGVVAIDAAMPLSDYIAGGAIAALGAIAYNIMTGDKDA